MCYFSLCRPLLDQSLNTQRCQVLQQSRESINKTFKCILCASLMNHSKQIYSFKLQ